MAKKKPISKSPAALEKEQYNAFLQRLRIACELMVEKGFFEQIPKHHLSQLFRQRMPPLKLEFAPGILTKEQENAWHQQFKLRLTDLFVKTPNGKLPLADFFREGMLLANYAQTMLRTDHSPVLYAIVQAYRGGSELYLKATEPIIAFVNSLCVIYSDINKNVVVSDYTSTTILGAVGDDNKIIISSHRPSHDRVKIDGQTREVINVSWTDMKGGIAPVKVAPARLGLANADTTPVQVFCQHHALARLHERLSFHPGALLYLLENLFYDRHSDLKMDGQLLPFFASDKKLGYLVADLLDDKLVIRTFLFLTNDGTPEGRKLAELTRLKKLDKQFLGIDTLMGFRKLKIADDPILSQLFTEAGCADLLDLQTLDPLLQTEVAMKNPGFLLRFLENSPFMQKRI